MMYISGELSVFYGLHKEFGLPVFGNPERTQKETRARF
jgi:hypothetical protein